MCGGATIVNDSDDQGRLVTVAGREARPRLRNRKTPQLPGKIVLLWLCDLFTNRIFGGVKTAMTIFSTGFIALIR